MRKETKRKKRNCPAGRKEQLTTPHQRASAKLLNFSGLASFSARYMRKEEKMSARNPIYTVVKSSCRFDPVVHNRIEIFDEMS